MLPILCILLALGTFPLFLESFHFYHSVKTPNPGAQAKVEFGPIAVANHEVTSRASLPAGGSEGGL